MHTQLVCEPNILTFQENLTEALHIILIDGAAIQSIHYQDSGTRFSALIVYTM